MSTSPASKKPASARKRTRPRDETPRAPVPKATPAAPRARPLAGFWLGLQMPPGMAEREQVRMERSLHDHLADCGLRLGGGTQRTLYVEPESAGRELTLGEQVELADWCLRDTKTLQIAVSSLTSVSLMPPLKLAVWRVQRWDLAAMSVSMLYRLGRIRAEQYVEILGGFVPEHRGELFA